MVFQPRTVSKYLFHKRVRLVKSVQRINHLACLESPRRNVEMQMLCLVMGQVGLSLFNFGGRNSLKPLSISRSLLLIRDVYSTKVPFGILVVWYKAVSACTSGSASRYDRSDQILDPNKFDPPKIDLPNSTNRSEGQCLVQFYTVFVHRSTGVVSPKTELS